MKNNVEVWYCRDVKRYHIIDASFNVDNNSYYCSDRVSINDNNCTHDTLIRDNLTPKEANDLYLVLTKLKGS